MRLTKHGALSGTLSGCYQPPSESDLRPISIQTNKLKEADRSYNQQINTVHITSSAYNKSCILSAWHSTQNNSGASLQFIQFHVKNFHESSGSRKAIWRTMFTVKLAATLLSMTKDAIHKQDNPNHHLRV